MIDRSDCPARKHGTSSAYQNQACRCEDARRQQRLYIKGRELARARGQVGRTGMVPTWRAVRRFQALARMGYSARDVQAAAWGWKRTYGTGSWAVSATMGPLRFGRLDALYQQWSAVPGSSTRAKAYAERLNFSAPLDWDNIDDPDEVPYNKTEDGLRQRRLERERERDRVRDKQRWQERKARREAAA